MFNLFLHDRNNGYFTYHSINSKQGNIILANYGRISTTIMQQS